MADRVLFISWGTGGLADHVEPAALAWLRRWRPQGSSTLLTRCTCQSGRYRVSN